MRLRTGLIALCAALCAALTPTVANAATSTYAPQEDAQKFTTSVGGWTHDREYSNPALCILGEIGVVCPSVTNTYVGSGGADGASDGHIRTSYGILVSLLGQSSTGIWTSPEFTYNGAQGKPAQKLTFSAKFRSNVAELLGVGGSNNATYSVAIVPSEPGEAVTVINNETLPNVQSEWKAIDEVSIPGNALQIGQKYRIVIRTSLNTPVASGVGSGNVDYDDVVLKAQSASKKQLKNDVKEGFGDVAATNGPRAAVALRCPAAVAPSKCRINVKVKLGRKIITKRKVVTLRAGKAKAVTLKVKKRFQKKILKAKRVVVLAQVKAGGEKFTAKKRVKLRKS